MPFLFTTVLEVPARAVRQDKDTKGIILERKKTVSIHNDMILYMRNPKEYTHTHTHTIRISKHVH